MRLTLVLLGWTWELSLEPTAAESETNSLDGGTAASTPIGFVARHDRPDDADIHRPCSPWEDDSEA